MKYVDIHCHLNFPEYDHDRSEVISHAQKEDIGIINVGTDISMSERAIEVAEKNKNIWATVAIHPNHTKGDFVFSKIEKLAENSKVVAIGECGLDYFRSDPEDVSKQKEYFEKHILLANKVKKPLMLHVRNGKTGPNAYLDALEILKSQAKVKFNFHFFAGSIEDLKLILDAGGSVSFTGVLTFTRDYDAVVKYAPIDRIMSETDAPFVAPVPHRGKRNEPLFIKEIVSSIGKIRGQDEGVVRLQLVDNARKMFAI